TGTLAVSFDVPIRGIAGSATIEGPGFSVTAGAATEYPGLTPGSYTITAAQKAVDLSTLVGAPAVQTVTVSAGPRTDAVVAYTYDCRTVIAFADAAVAGRVRTALGLATNAPVTCAQLATLTTLDVGNACCDPLPPASLDGLQHALNLDTLSAAFTQVSD